MSLVFYDNELDPDCYPVRLLLSLLDLPYRRVPVDTFPGNEKPPGHDCLPVLVHGARSVQGVPGVLEYLAAEHESSWLPSDEHATRRWLEFAGTELSCAREARSQALFATTGPSPGLVTEAARCLQAMDDHLTEREFDFMASHTDNLGSGGCWFVGDRPSIVDVALIAPACLSADYGLEHDIYPALRRWIRRVRALPGFLTMPGIPNYY